MGEGAGRPGGIGLELALKLGVDVFTLGLTNKLMPASYMDEPFHVTQTQHYCAGRFHVWDPKITTFPGLYLLGTAWSRALAALQQLGVQLPWEPCSAASLRAVNVLLAALCLLVLYALVCLPPPLEKGLQQQEGAQHGGKQPQRQGQTAALRHDRQPPPQARGATLRNLLSPASPELWALTLSCMPLHWFYTTLYYTDVGGTLCLLFCVLCSRHGAFLAAGVAGGAAVLFRQPNAVWVAFVLGAAVLSLVQAQEAQEGAAHQGAAQGDAAQQGAIQGDAAQQGAVQGDAAQQGAAQGDAAQAAQPCTGEQAVGVAGQQTQQGSGSPRVEGEDGSWGPGAGSLVHELAVTLFSVWRHRGQVVSQLWPLTLPPAAFVAFAAHNGGVAVGDKDAHQPVHHPAQLVYCLLFLAVFLGPVLVSYLPGGLRGLGAREAAATLCLLCALAGAALRSAPPPHAYLLADNRHFTFYLWRRLLGRGVPSVRLGLAVGAGATALVLGHVLTRRVCRMWLLGFAACAAAVLVPAWLLELRYFSAVFFLVAVHLPRPSAAACCTTLALYVAVHAATLYLLLARPFTWMDGTEARFMW